MNQEKTVEFWREIAIAFCLMLVIEGIVPFLYPQRWRLMVAKLAMVDNKVLRIYGLISMLVGTAILYTIQ